MSVKVILVTGASSGFGRMCAEALAGAGHVVYASMRGTDGHNAEQVAAIRDHAAAHGVDLRALDLDVSDTVSVENAVARVVADHGRLDVLVHNAGHMVYGPSEAFSPDQLAALYDVNVVGSQRVNRAALPHLRDRGDGLLVWMSSSSAAGGTPPYLGPYFAAKAAMDSLAVSYARELALWGIETSIIVPGAFTQGTNHFAHAGSPDDTAVALATIGKARTGPDDARILGVHLEGPFLSPQRPGTHPVDLLRAPDVALAGRLLAAGPVTQVTIAPELPGALDVIAACVRAGVLVSCGHSDATAAQAHAAFDRGARLVTHLFDAMRPFAHRDPGIAGAALTRDTVTVGLIADPSHLAAETIRLAFRAAPGRVVLVTDALAASGCPDGRYRLGDVEFDSADGIARRADGTLVGTTITLLDAVRHACDIGVTVEDAVNAATRTPAALFPGRPIGLLRPGDPADLLVLDDSFVLHDIVRAGPAAASDRRPAWTT